MHIGFLGFGEAGSLIAAGLHESGVCGLVAYDCNFRNAELGERIRTRAKQADTRLVESSRDLASEADLIFSLVTATSANDAARQTAPFLTSSHIYCDCNSVSPATKGEVAGIIESSGSAFVEASIMAPVFPQRHRVPILLNGRHAGDLARKLSPLGMNVSVMHGEPGAAAAVKLCRSIVVKGLEALMVECTVASRHFGCEKAVFDSLSETFPGMDWHKLAESMPERVMQHGTRRAAEMREAASMQRDAGLTPFMSLASAEVQDWRERLGVTGSLESAADFLDLLAPKTAL